MMRLVCSWFVFGLLVICMCLRWIMVWVFWLGVSVLWVSVCSC